MTTTTTINYHHPHSVPAGKGARETARGTPAMNDPLSPAHDAQLEEIVHRGLIYLRHGAVVHETIIASTCPDVDIPHLLECAIDHIIETGDGGEEIHWPSALGRRRLVQFPAQCSRSACRQQDVAKTPTLRLQRW